MASHLSLKEVKRWPAVFKQHLRIYRNHVYTTPLLRILPHTGKKKHPNNPNKTIFCLDSFKIIPVWLLLYILSKHLFSIVFSTRQLANEINVIQFVIGMERNTKHLVPNIGIRCHLKLLWLSEISALCWQIWHSTYKQLMPFSGLTAEIAGSFEMATRLQYLNSPLHNWRLMFQDTN